MSDLIEELFTTTEDFIYRFKDNLPTYSEQLKIHEEEVNELLQSVWDYGLGKDTKAHVCEEFVDGIITGIGLLLQCDIRPRDIEQAMRKVIEKLDAKTLKTHHVDSLSGKIVRNGK